ncbi:adhesion G protein-coupled receptor E5 isoform X2 [Trichomycterus rosablanca]|uniref:adhesion G protein-coupled receptor E5 isoform X2 n=1 Tax=Trichomycterus rosablanca TaxID=2290929 RepID=UPI002F35861C
MGRRERRDLPLDVEAKWIILVLGVLLTVLPEVKPCEVGYQQQGGECIDEDECNPVNLCGNNSRCFNTPGSYYCQCREGYTAKTINFTAITGQCKDVNECFEKNPCPENSRCLNTAGSYWCECSTGFQNKTVGSSYVCSDKDECDGEEHVCGVNGTCSNTEGSFHCQCDPGFSNFGNNQTKCAELKCDPRPNHTSKEGADMMSNMVELFKTSCESLVGPSGEQRTGETLLEHLLNVTGDVLSGGNLNSGSTVSAFFGTVEDTMRLIAPQLGVATTRMENDETEAWLAVRKDETPPTGRVTLDSDDVQLNMSWKAAVGTDYPGYAFVALVSYKSLNLTNALKPNPDAESSDRNTTYTLNSRVVTALVSNKDTSSLSEPVTLTFKHLQEGEVAKGLNYSCVYWDQDQADGAWSGRGCMKAEFNSTHAACTWNHLSSFAVLMALYPIQDSFQLVWITWVGLSLSLVCLLLCILTFIFCRSIKGTRTTIHLHLCVCLFVANFIFLFFISSTRNKIGCAAVAALLHYFYLSAFCFMLLEGVQLYRMVVLVFHTTLRPLYLFGVGYGIPLAIVIISAIAFPSGYGTERHCWLSLDGDFIWSFLAPVCIVILLNSFFFIITVWKLMKKFSSLNPDLSKLRKLRGFVLTAVAQLCVLGGMWIFGCFLFQEEGTLVMAYLFTLLNSLQGVLIFVMHCLMSKSVREEYRKLCGGSSKSQKKRYSDFSSNQSSNSQRPLRSAPSTGESQI